VAIERLTSERLTSEKNVWLASVRPDGRAHLVPIWFVYVRDRFWIATGASSVKVGNLAANPAVSVSLEDGNDPLVAEGDARLHPPPFPDDVVNAFGDKFAWDITRGFDDDIGEIALCEITVARWVLGGPA
jgi:F420H(2)-dependent biliverdin reductase